jgi:hypothetical protein
MSDVDVANMCGSRSCDDPLGAVFLLQLTREGVDSIGSNNLEGEIDSRPEVLAFVVRSGSLDWSGHGAECMSGWNSVQWDVLK